MQSLNNLSPRGRQLLIGAVTVLIVLPLLYLIYTSTNNSDPTKKGTYYDKGSGETVTNTNQSPEKYGTDGDTQTYLGISELLTYGVTKYQVNALKLAFTDYGKTRTPQAQEYSIATKTIAVADRDPDNESTSEFVSFDVLVNRKDTYKATLRYFDLSSVQLTLKTKSGELVYTSKEIDGSAATTNE